MNIKSRYFKSKIAVMVAALACPLLFGGCSVKYSLSGASIAPEIQTVSIARFPNNALLVAPILSSTLTDALQDRFTRQTRLAVVPENGDLRFEGEVNGVKVRSGFLHLVDSVNAYTMALANELRPFGVTVCAVMPGDIHTGFTAARRKIGEGDDIYQGRISRSVARMEHDEQTGMDPAKAGAFIAKVAMKQRVKPIYTIRFDYQFLALLTRILPYRFLNWLIGVIYGK